MSRPNKIRVPRYTDEFPAKSEDLHVRVSVILHSDCVFREQVVPSLRNKHAYGQGVCKTASCARTQTNTQRPLT